MGCGVPSAVLRSVGDVSFVEEKVVGEIKRHPIPGICHELELEGLVSAGLIQRTRMDGKEYEFYLALVQAPLGERLGSGESASLAVAQSRGLTVILDENKGRSFVANRFPEIDTVSSLSLLVSAAARSGWSQSDLREVVSAARTHARMGVPRDEKALLALVMGK